MNAEVDVLFVHTNINAFHFNTYHFGIGYLSSMLKKNGYKTMLRVIETPQDKEKLEEDVIRHKPKIIGFSSVSSQFVFIKGLAARLKEIHDGLIVCGGVHPTVFPECLLTAAALDGIFIGESEHAFLEFVSAVSKKRDYKQTDNFCYKKDGKLIKNRLKPRVKNLEELPYPDRQIYDYQSIIDKNEGVANIMTNRGCPFNCAYCSNHAIAKAYGEERNTTRYNSVDNVFAEIRDLRLKYKFSRLWFEDDLFILNKKWLDEFILRYKKEVKLPFMCHIRPDVCTRDILFQLKDAGCYRIFLAVESANDHIRNVVMRRNISKLQLKNTFKWAKEAGIETLSVNIIGIPGETKETILETINFNREMNPTIVGINLYSPYEGTALGDYCRDNNLISSFKPESFLDRRESRLALPTISHASLMKLYNNFHYLVYKGVDPVKERHYLFEMWGRRYRKLEKTPMVGRLFKGVKKTARSLGQKVLKAA